MTVLGIDAGNERCMVGFFKYTGLELVSNKQGQKDTPSVICFDKSRILFGQSAMNLASRNPKCFIYDVKCMLGQSFDDQKVQEKIKQWPFDVEKAPDGGLQVVIDSTGERKVYQAYELWGMILKNMADTANERLERPSSQVVITVPVSFSEKQRADTKKAAQSAGLEVIELVDNATAAKLAYGLSKTVRGQLNESGDVLVFDFGEKQLEVSYLEDKDGKLESIATSCDPRLGGADFDERLRNYAIQGFLKTHQVDFGSSPRSLRKLGIQCEKAKIALSGDTKTNIVMENPETEEEISIQVTRKVFEDLCQDLVDRCLSLVVNVIRDAKKEATNIHEILCIGGTSKIPKVQSRLQERLGKNIYTGFDPQEAPTIGACLTGATTYSISDLKIYAQGMGNAEQLAAMSFLETITTPSQAICEASVGFEVGNQEMWFVILKGTPLPHTDSVTFPVTPSTTSIQLSLYEGEGRRITDNRYLGGYRVEIPHIADQNLAVDVKVTMTTTGTLHVQHRITTPWSVPQPVSRAPGTEPYGDQATSQYAYQADRSQYQQAQQSESQQYYEYNQYEQRKGSSAADVYLTTEVSRPTEKSIHHSQTEKAQKLIDEMKRLHHCMEVHQLDSEVTGYVEMRILQAMSGEQEFSRARTKFVKNTFKTARQEILNRNPSYIVPEWFTFRKPK